MDKFNVQLAKDLYHQDYDESLWKIIAEGDMEQDGKYQYQINVVEDLTTGKLYEFSVSRSGSYHSDWYYDWEYSESTESYDFQEVEPKVISKTVYVAVGK